MQIGSDSPYQGTPNNEAVTAAANRPGQETALCCADCSKLYPTSRRCRPRSDRSYMGMFGQGRLDGWDLSCGSSQ